MDNILGGGELPQPEMPPGGVNPPARPPVRPPGGKPPAVPPAGPPARPPNGNNNTTKMNCGQLQ